MVEIGSTLYFVISACIDNLNLKLPAMVVLHFLNQGAVDVHGFAAVTVTDLSLVPTKKRSSDGLTEDWRIGVFRRARSANFSGAKARKQDGRTSDNNQGQSTSSQSFV